MKPQKRKQEQTDVSAKKRQICILQCEGAKSDGFTYLSSVSDPAERLGYLKNIRTKRLSEPIGCKTRMLSACEAIPDVISDDHGYHQTCYQRFTRNLDRLHGSEPTAVCSGGSRTSRRGSADGQTVLFSPDCIFCNKEGRIAVKRSGTWSTEAATKFKSDGWVTVVEAAEAKKDEKLLTQIRNVDLFSAEAQFHPSCRKTYTSDSERGRGDDEEARLYQQHLEKAHKYAFDMVCDVVEKDMLSGGKVMKLTDLRDIYITDLANSAFSNPDYRSEKLKSKLEKAYRGKIVFCPLGVGVKLHSQLVYSLELKLECAVHCAFLLGTADNVTDVATTLRHAQF